MRLRVIAVLCEVANQDEVGLASIQPWVGALSACGKQLHAPQLCLHAGSWLQAVPALALVCELVGLVFELVELVCDVRNL